MKDPELEIDLASKDQAKAAKGKEELNRQKGTKGENS